MSSFVIVDCFTIPERVGQIPVAVHGRYIDHVDCSVGLSTYGLQLYCGANEGPCSGLLTLTATHVVTQKSQTYTESETALNGLSKNKRMKKKQSLHLVVTYATGAERVASSEGCAVHVQFTSVR